MMREFKGKVSTNVVGSEVEFYFDAEDDATEEEIEELGMLAAMYYVEVYWVEVE